MLFSIVIPKGARFTQSELVTHLQTWNVDTRDMLTLINQLTFEYLNMAYRP